MTGGSTTGRADRKAGISAIVPALDEAANIAAIVGQLATADETIVVDGGSTDATRELAIAAGARLVGSGRGRAVQMNAGAAVARGAILVFVHADSRLPPGWHDAVAAVARSGAQRWGRFDVEIDAPGILMRVVGAAMNLRSRLTGICTGDQCIFVDRAAFDSVGGFPPIALMEDIEISSRLRRRFGRPAVLRQRVGVSARRWQRDGVLRTILRMWAYRAMYWAGVSAERLHALYYRRAP